jgi:hypothetical protein
MSWLGIEPGPGLPRGKRTIYRKAIRTAYHWLSKTSTYEPTNAATCLSFKPLFVMATKYDLGAAYFRMVRRGLKGCYVAH